jgi:hypothetical protein
MAIARVQSATAATGGTRASTLAPSLAGTPTNTNTLILVVVWDNNPAGGSGGVNLNSVSGSLAQLGSTIAQGSLRMALFRLTGTIAGDKTVTATFSSATYASAWYSEFSGCNSVVFQTAENAAYGSLTIVGNTPITWAPLTGDLAYFFSGIRDAATPTATWSEIADLNNSSGQFAQLEVQESPATTSSPQNVTGEVTWANLSGTDASSISWLLVVSQQTPLQLSSQEPMEVVGTDTADGRVSQVPLEVIGTDTAKGHVSQAVLEAISTDTAKGHVSQVVMEVICPQYVRVSQVPMEIMGTDTASVRMSQVVMEVVWSSQGQRRRVVDDEWFMY